MAAKTKNAPMCAVTIGYQTLLMPASAGMKVVELLQNAVTCRENLLHPGMEYVVGEQIEVEYRSVRHNQVRMPGQPLMLEQK